MSNTVSNSLFEPDPSFAKGWFVDDALAQGALKHASVVILDVLDDVRAAIATTEPEFDDFGPLGDFPISVRALLSPRMIEKLSLAATIVGWKLAQPGTPIPPGCIAEELALELIRQQAEASLEFIDAPTATIDATKGLYKVCVNDNIHEFFESHSAAYHALAASYSVKDRINGMDVRLAKWFKPFFLNQIGGGIHPDFLDTSNETGDGEATPLVVVEPEAPPQIDRQRDGWFRVCVRTWEDEPPDTEAWDPLPATWLYRIEAPNAEQALNEVLEKFPEGAYQEAAFDSDDVFHLGSSDIARISIDVQRGGLSQERKIDDSFHFVGELERKQIGDHLPRLAGYLAENFPAAVVAQDEEHVFLGVTIRAESHEEAQADFEDALLDFCDAVGLEDVFLSGSSSGQGARNANGLWREILTYRHRW